MNVADLAGKFRLQQEFAGDYSPLYACIFGAIADWLSDGSDTDLADWLLEAGHGRKAFDVPLLLLAGLHRDILDRIPSVAPLSCYYPTAGGNLPCGSTQFLSALREAIWARRQSLTAFIQEATVQTNETGRGIIWLLPLHYTGWEAVHLVDLGASAGLNLAADKRAFRFVNEDGAYLLDIGQGEPVQFLVRTSGNGGRLPALAVSLRPLPRIASRTGCDIAPFVLENPRDELTLSAYVWGDHPQRLQRLQEGITALHGINQGDVPIRLHAADLPDALPIFLEQHGPNDSQAPVVIYNSYMTIYLKNNGADMRQHVETWAQNQSRPVLWIQWEPAWGGPDPPEFGWIRWSADLWWRGRQEQWHLAWVHPHGTHIQWLPGFGDWIDAWRDGGLLAV